MMKGKAFYETGTGYYVKVGKSKIGVRSRAEALKFAKKHKLKVGYGKRRLLRVRKSPKKRRSTSGFNMFRF
jgi:hypothetical protein